MEQEVEVTATILAVAAELFLAKGYEATTMEAVAKTAGIYKNAVYKRFPNKQTLFIAVFATKLEEWNQLAKNWEIKPAKTLEEKLVGHLIRAAKWSMHSEVRAFRRLRASVGEDSQGLLREMRSLGLSHHAGLIERDIIDFATQEGRTAKEPGMVASALMSIIAAWIEEKPIDANIPIEDVEQFAQKTIDIIYRGQSAWC